MVSHTHVFGTRLLNELRFGYMKVGADRSVVNRGNDFAARSDCWVSRPILATSASRRSRPAACTARWATRPSSRRATTSISSCSTTSPSIEAHHHLKFGGYFFHLQLQPRAARQRAGCVHLHGTVLGQCLRRLPARLPDDCDIGHRPRRRERPDELAAPLRPGRLAGARQPDVQPRAALRVQPAHVRREQPAVIDRPVGPWWTIRPGQRRGRQPSTRARPIAAAADSDSLYRRPRRLVGIGGSWIRAPFVWRLGSVSR